MIKYLTHLKLKIENNTKATISNAERLKKKEEGNVKINLGYKPPLHSKGGFAAQMLK